MIRKYIIKITKVLLLFYPRYICKREFEKPNEYTFNERPVEFRFVFEQISEIYPKKSLDIGSGTTALPHLIRNCGVSVTAIDNIRDYWPSGMMNRHYHVLDDDITNTRLNEKFDLVTCISVLEHIEEYDKAIKNMFKLLKPNSYLILTCPYTEHKYVKNVYDLPDSTCGHNASYICQSFSRDIVEKWLKKYKAKIIKQEYWKFWKGECWTEGDEVIPPVKSANNEDHQLTCILFQRSNCE